MSFEMNKKLFGLIAACSLVMYSTATYSAYGYGMHKINNTECLRGNQCGSTELAGLLSSLGTVSDYKDLTLTNYLANRDGWTQIRVAPGSVTRPEWIDWKKVYLHEGKWAPNTPSYYSIDLSQVKARVTLYEVVWNNKNWKLNGTKHDLGEKTIAEWSNWNDWRFHGKYKSIGQVDYSFSNDDHLKLDVHPGNTGRHYRKLRLPYMAFSIQYIQYDGNNNAITNEGTFLALGSRNKEPRLNDRKCYILTDGNDQKAVKVKFKDIEANASGTLQEIGYKLSVKCTGWNETYPGQNNLTLGIYGLEIDNVVSDFKVQPTMPTVSVNGKEQIALFKDNDNSKMSDSMYVEGSFTSGKCGTASLNLNSNAHDQIYIGKGPFDMSQPLAPKTENYETLYWRLCKKDNKIIESGTYRGQAKISIKYN